MKNKYYIYRLDYFNRGRHISQRECLIVKKVSDKSGREQRGTSDSDLEFDLDSRSKVI